MKRSQVSLIVLTLLTPLGWAGSIRDDQPVSNYRELALAEPFRPAGYVFHPDVGFWHSGTLVSPYHILTSAHAFDPDGTGHVTRSITNVRVGFDSIPGQGTTYSVQDVLLHPSWPHRAAQNDLALIVLSEPVLDVQPARISTTPPASGVGVAVGYGHQTLGNGEPVETGQPRLAFENEIDFIGPEDGKLSDYLQLPSDVDVGLTIRADFDHPSGLLNSYGRPIPLHLEGGPETGDSGGPLFVQHEDEWYLAGVLFGSFNPHQESGYGSVMIWAPLFPQETQRFLADSMLPLMNTTAPPNRVPEPASFGLAALGLGTILIGWRSRRTRLG